MIKKLMYDNYSKYRNSSSFFFYEATKVEAALGELVSTENKTMYDFSSQGMSDLLKGIAGGFVKVENGCFVMPIKQIKRGSTVKTYVDFDYKREKDV